MAKLRRWERPRPRTRSKVAVALALVVLAVGAVAWGLDRRSTITVDMPPEPHPGLPGTWVSTHIVDVPDGGTVSAREVRARSSRSTLSVRVSALGLGGDAFVSCQVEVWSPGEDLTPPAHSQPVRVGDAPAVFAPRRGPDRPFGVFWTGPQGQPANVRCFQGKTDAASTVAVAEWVRFTTGPVTTPFRLRYVPPGYRADTILFRGNDPPLLVLVPPPDSITLPYLDAYYYPGTGEVPGRETATVNGRPVAMDAYHRLLCFTEGPTVCVSEYSVDPMGNSQMWPPEVRRLLVRIAAGLVVAPDIDDRSTWFEGRLAFPN